MKSIVRDDGDGAAPCLLRSRARARIGPVDVTSLQRFRSASARCTKDASSRSESRSSPNALHLTIAAPGCFPKFIESIGRKSAPSSESYRMFSCAPSGLPPRWFSPRVPLRSTQGYDPAPLRGSKALISKALSKRYWASRRLNPACTLTHFALAPPCQFVCRVSTMAI